MRLPSPPPSAVLCYKVISSEEFVPEYLLSKPSPMQGSMAAGEGHRVRRGYLPRATAGMIEDEFELDENRALMLCLQCSILNASGAVKGLVEIAEPGDGAREPLP